jgi:hypothetical protein
MLKQAAMTTQNGQLFREWPPDEPAIQGSTVGTMTPAVWRHLDSRSVFVASQNPAPQHPHIVTGTQPEIAIQIALPSSGLLLVALCSGVKPGNVAIGDTASCSGRSGPWILPQRGRA